MAVTINETTIAAAVMPADDRIKLTSGATVKAGHVAYAAREAMLFLAQVAESDPTLWYVTRGYSGTPAEAHNAAAKIKTGPAGAFQFFNPAGAADANKVQYLPWINVFAGDVFDINANAWRQIGTGGVLQGTAAWP